MKKDDRTETRTLVIGAGIVGASIAYHLAKRGVEVTILERNDVASGASGKSFAWINAHHFKNESYHRIRYQSLSEYHRLDRELAGTLGLQWCGALSFDAVGDAFDQRFRGFQKLGYPVEIVAHNQFRELEPNYGHPPGRALHLPMEAAIEPVQACKSLIEGVVRYGGKTVFGSDVVALKRERGSLTGVETRDGAIDADRVVIAAGVGAEAILETVNVQLPMANQFGVMLHSRPVEPTLNHVIWGDRIHMKQQADGRLVVGEVFSETWTDRDPSEISAQMLHDAKRHLPDVDIVIEHTTIGLRPIPRDGMPVIGPVGGIEGLYVTVMHSGMTLAPIVGRMAADEIVDGARFESLEPYRLSRFRDSATKAAS